METLVPSAAAVLVARLTPKCRLCSSDFRRRWPGEKYCERCRGRRSRKRATATEAVDQAIPAGKCNGSTEYTIHTPTFGIMNINGDRIPVMVPVGSWICVSEVGPIQEANALVEVIWEKRQLLMFIRDVRARATRVAPADESSSPDES